MTLYCVLLLERSSRESNRKKNISTGNEIHISVLIPKKRKKGFKAGLYIFLCLLVSLAIHADVGSYYIIFSRVVCLFALSVAEEVKEELERKGILTSSVSHVSVVRHKRSSSFAYFFFSSLSELPFLFFFLLSIII